jgi:hypothetical protein
MGIVSAGSLRNLEVRLSMSIDNVLQAEVDLNRLRAQAGLPEIEKQFYLASEHRIALREACAEAVEAAKTAKPKYGRVDPDAWPRIPLKDVGDPRFDPRLCDRPRPPRPQTPEEQAKTTADKIIEIHRTRRAEIAEIKKKGLPR